MVRKLSRRHLLKAGVVASIVALGAPLPTLQDRELLLEAKLIRLAEQNPQGLARIAALVDRLEKGNPNGSH